MGRQKCAVGSAVIFASLLASTLCLYFRWTELSRPWSVLLGFGCGVTLGVGTALALKGLVEVRAARW